MRWLALLLVFAGCRTQIDPIVLEDEGPLRWKKNGECMVTDYRASADVPEGAKNLGLVKIERKESDEVTLKALRAEICKLGGNALSGLAWIRAAGASFTDEPIELEATAWLTQ